MEGGRHDIMMGKLAKCLELTKVCMEGVQGISSPKFNNEQCDHLVEKLKATIEIARVILEDRQAQPRENYSITDLERWVEILKLLLVLGKQVESFLRDCGKDAWIQMAMTLANVEEYVSSIGFNLELCKVALCIEQGVTKRYTLNEVGNLKKKEMELVKLRSRGDAKTLFNKATMVSHSSKVEDMKLAKCLLLKLEGDRENPIFDEDNSNLMLKMFEWVRNRGERAEQIGRGASARVYKVMWFGIPVAKKSFDGSNNQEFLQEVKVLSQLHHPNITSMFCCNMNKMECSIVMELMDGSLYDMLRSRKGEDGNFLPFSHLESLNLMLQIGEGVEYLHRKKIVHRDLKSANILVKRVEALDLGVEIVHLKVADFGLSKTKETSISFSTMTYNVGTCRWMAPEIIKIHQDNERSCEELGKLPKYNFKGDIYSFGMVCYEILAGEVPFQNEVSAIGVKRKILSGLRPKLPEHCSPMLAKLIEKCWNEVAKERPCISDVCLELKYLKYLHLTSKPSQGHCNPCMEEEEKLQRLGAHVRHKGHTRAIGASQIRRQTHLLHNCMGQSRKYAITAMPIWRRIGIFHYYPRKQREYSKVEVEVATEGFKRCIGIQDYSIVYHGRLQPGTEVAVHIMKWKWKQQWKFREIVNILSNIHHKNIISLVGYCCDDQQQMLIYEYIAKRSCLDDLLHGAQAKALDWKTRLNIGLQVALGLQYVHTRWYGSLEHDHVMSQNILINSKNVAKVTGIDLRKIISRCLGVEPMYPKTDVWTSDVYSFGVVLVELLTGRPANDFRYHPRNVVDWVWLSLKNGAITEILDPKLLLSSTNFDSLWKVAEVAKLCLDPTKSSSQLTMSEVVVGLRHAQAALKKNVI